MHTRHPRDYITKFIRKPQLAMYIKLRQYLIATEGGVCSSQNNCMMDKSPVDARGEAAEKEERFGLVRWHSLKVVPLSCVREKGKIVLDHLPVRCKCEWDKLDHYCELLEVSGEVQARAMHACTAARKRVYAHARRVYGLSRGAAGARPHFRHSVTVELCVARCTNARVLPLSMWYAHHTATARVSHSSATRYGLLAVHCLVTDRGLCEERARELLYLPRQSGASVDLCRARRARKSRP